LPEIIPLFQNVVDDINAPFEGMPEKVIYEVPEEENK
jgi:hypothetical protein